MSVHSLIVLLLLLLLFFFALPPLSSSTSSSLVGINYGLVADNLPPPSSVPPLLRSIGVGRVKLYNPDPTVLRSFANTGIELIIGLPDQCLSKAAAASSAFSLSWVQSNVASYLPKTKISAITVGNEVLTNANDTSLAQFLLPAMESIHSALVSLSLDRQVVVTSTHSVAILSNSFPPSAGKFKENLIPYICPILNFHSKTNSPFLINAYPFFAYKSEPGNISLDYALFEPNQGVADPGSGLKYDNMLFAQIDAVYAAIKAAGAAGKGVEVRVSETGWPSAGDEDEVGATPENAAKYNGNLMKLVMEGKGTPMRPTAAVRVYVFALFNENLKLGPKSERNYGLFKPDGTPSYPLGITVPPENTTTGGGGGGGGGGVGGGGGAGGGGGGGSAEDSPPSDYYDVSSATSEWLRQWRFGGWVTASIVVLLG